MCSKSEIYCHICYDDTDDYMICDTCDNHYCDGCSYTYTLHYQHQGSRCYHCSDQRRRKPITKSQIRKNKLKRFINLVEYQ